MIRVSKVLVPCNLYGPHDKFSADVGHVLGALIGKACLPSPSLEVLGTGAARRQFMHVSDLARIIDAVLLGDHRTPIPDELICAPPEDFPIRDVAAMLGDMTGKTVAFDTSKTDGQLRKLGKTDKFQACFPDFAWTPLQEGLRTTLAWRRGAAASLSKEEKER